MLDLCCLVWEVAPAFMDMVKTGTSGFGGVGVGRGMAYKGGHPLRQGGIVLVNSLFADPVSCLVWEFRSQVPVLRP